MNSNSPQFAFACLRQGFSELQRPELRRYLVMPLLINLLLYSLAFASGYYAVANVMPHLIPEWLSWLSWILWPLFFVSFLFISFFSFTLLANLIASPWYGSLSAHALSLITGQPYIPVEQAWHQAMWGELKRIGYWLARLIPLLLLSLIPVVNAIAPLLWGAFGAWALAMEFLSYPAENRGLNFVQQKHFVQQRRIGVLSFGLLVNLGLMIPLVNLMVGQAAVIGASLWLQEALRETQKP